MTANNNDSKIQKLAMNFIQHRDNITFTALVNVINWGLRKQIYDIVKNNSITDEILSKTLENIYYKCDRYNPKKANFSTWIYKIAYNNSLKYIQEQEKINYLVYGEDISNIYDSELKTSETEDYDDRLLCKGSELVDIIFKKIENPDVYKKERVVSEMYEALVDCIQFLPDNLKMVMHERFINSKKIEDIALDNNVPVSSVKNWLRKGKTVLKKTVKKKYSNLYFMYTNQYKF